ncbi:hypothetical protein [Maribacter sp. HTCC2170]|uniref:hypothetical protein n=1 Tax=Maribacter sp. (strain HTCC2170 / KCCM 42371) TaxID=313603 RepID=UPI00006BD493|nr:hypothetical protein [Maribacter sp. HTCC2170]EAR02085.1 hypothetical protein FB2170_02340 [Maribacter sp. HTCC2170]
MINKESIICLFVSLCTFSIVAQSKKEIEIKEIFWGANDTQKENADIPSKWQDQSAVILYKEYFYDYHKFAKQVDYVHSFRKRIMLLDKAAIDDHSEFSFTKRLRARKGWGRRGTNYVGVKIIKPDGSEKEIEIDEEAVRADDEYKLAISGLEEGDILDYYIYSIEPFKQKYGYTFEPITRTISDEYPIKEMVLKFNTENDFFINFNSYNGAPELAEIKTDKRNDRRYTLKAENIDKNDFPFWYYPQIELPYYKFQVTFARRGSHENRIFDFISEDEDVIKKVVSKEDVLELYHDHWDYDAKNSRFRELDKFFEGHNLSEEEKIKQAYYYFRHFYLTQFIERSVYAQTEIIPNMVYGSTAYDDHFDAFENTSLMAEYLDRHEIKFDRILAVPRYEGTIKDVLFKSEISTFLEVHVNGKTLYVPPLSQHSDIDELAYKFENTEVYALNKIDGKNKLNNIKTVSTRKTSFEDNGTVDNAIITLNEDFSGFKVEKNVAYKGNSKSSAQEDLLYYFDYINEDYKKFNNQNYIDKQVKKKKRKDQIQKESHALISKLKKRQGESIKKQTEKEYDLTIDEHTYEILETGRYGHESPLVTKEYFTIENQLVKKAGKNYIFEVGRLVGGQVSLTEKEKARTNNVYMYSPRSFENTIELKIPIGYSVGGLDKLNVNIENASGGFISSAKIEGDVLKIHTRKHYKNYFEPNANWPQIVDFLEAAYQFTQEKIIFKKGKSTAK